MAASIRALVKGEMKKGSKEFFGAAVFVVAMAALAVWFLVKALT